MSANAMASDRRVVSHHGALRAVQAALARAETLGIAVCVAVVDSAGTLAGFARMPHAFGISGDMAMRKAHSVAAVGLDAEQVEAALSQEAPRVREGIALSGFSFIRGGVPLREGEVVIGAIGVSGGSEAQDIECAQAGAAALEE